MTPASARWLGGLALTALLVACPATPGVTCRSHEDCRSLAEGYCSRAEICTRVCQATEDCPPASACVTEGARRVCLPTCSADGECVTGFGCQARDEAWVCRLTQPLEPPK